MQIDFYLAYRSLLVAEDKVLEYLKQVKHFIDLLLSTDDYHR